MLDLLARRQWVRGGVGLHERVGDHRQQAEDEAGDAQHDDRGEEAGRRVVRPRGRTAGLGRERAPHEAGAVGGSEHRPDEQTGEHRQVRDVAGQEGLVGSLLGDEAEQRRHPGHGQRSQGGDHREHRQPTTEAGQLAQVSGAGLVVDDADGQEQRGLEQSVREQQRRAGQGRLAGARADEHHEEAELADRAEGQQPLEVVLPQCTPAADDHRQQPDGQHDRSPRSDDGERRGQPGHQVDAGLDHGCGVQVGRDGRGGGHRGGQPRVERHLRALGERPDEDQHEGQRDAAAARRVGQDRRQRRRAGRLAEQDEPDEHHQSAERGDEQRLLRRATALLLLVAEADQQVRGDAGQLPEDVEQDQVVGQDQPEHRPGEAGEDPGEAPEPVLLRWEVGGAVEEDQRAHPGDQRHEQQ